jgi:Secretion system C-terminal sorting domain
MKKILFKLLILILGGVAFNANAQVLTKATVKTGTQANSFIVAIRPATTFTGKISTFQFTILIPSTVVPRPTLSILNNLNTNVSYILDVSTPENVNGTSYYVYNVVGLGSLIAPDVTYTTGIDNNMVELAISNGLSTNTTILIAQLPEGGLSFNSNYYIAVGGTDYTDVASMFYGTGAVNDASGYQGFSRLPLSNVGLPLTWLNFTAVKQDKNALLNWAVQESNNNHFEIERSVNGIDFAQIGSNVASKGAGSNNYSMTDAELINLKSNVVYYRIKQVDNDGKFTYSKVATIKLSTDKNYNIGIYPNPVNDNTTLTIDVAKATRAQVKVIDAAGKTVQTLSLVLNAGVNQKKINFSTLANGSYNVNVMSEDGLQETLKVVKQ